jgi:hypothetical protein
MADEFESELEIIPIPLKYKNPIEMIAKLRKIPSASNINALCWLNSTIVSIAYLRPLRAWFESNVPNAGSSMFAIYNLLKSYDKSLELAESGNILAAETNINSLRDTQAFWIKSEYGWDIGRFQSAWQYLNYRLPQPGAKGYELISHSFHEKISCNNCNYVIEKDHSEASIFVSGADGSLLKRLYGPISVDSCSICKIGQISTSYSFNKTPKLLIIKIDNSNSKLSDLRTIKAISNNSTVGQYNLTSVICYRDSHFTTYVTVKDSKAAYFDDMTKTAKVVRFPLSDSFYSSVYLCLYELVLYHDSSIIQESAKSSLNIINNNSSQISDLCKDMAANDHQSEIDEVMNRLSELTLGNELDTDCSEQIISEIIQSSHNNNNDIIDDNEPQQQQHYGQFQSEAEANDLALSNSSDEMDQKHSNQNSLDHFIHNMYYSACNNDNNSISCQINENSGIPDDQINAITQSIATNQFTLGPVSYKANRPRTKPNRKEYTSNIRKLHKEIAVLRPKANAKLLSSDSLAEALTYRCKCTTNCLGDLSKNQLIELRRINLSKTSKALTEFFVQYLYLNQKRNGKIKYRVKDDVECCRDAFMKAYGIGRDKLNAARRIFKNGHTIAIRVKPLDRSSPVEEWVSGWLSAFFESNCDQVLTFSTTIYIIC